MATSTRLRGKQGLIFTLKLGAAAAASYADDIKSFELTNEETDDSDLTFAEALAGLTASWTLSVTAIISADAASLHSYLWTNPGQDVTVVVGPYGNATPTATKPHYSFVANTGRKPSIANEARTSNEGADFEHELSVVGDITKIIA